MTGNSFGNTFRISTWGESHGIQIGVVIDGCPPKIPLDESIVQLELDRRKPGQAYTTPRSEDDKVKIVSGVFEGQTTGTPITLIVENTNQKPRDYEKIKNLYRPGHADFTYQNKYGIRDYRGGGRSSARETIARVAAGAIAKLVLNAHSKIQISAGLKQIGAVDAQNMDFQNCSDNAFNFLDASKVPKLEKLFENLIQQGDSVGAIIRCRAENVPVGLGEPVFDKLDAEIAKSMLSINAVKGIMIGDGLATSSLPGSEFRDQMDESGFVSNRAGGILGGISNGMPIEFDVYFKPTSSVAVEGLTQDNTGKEQRISVTGRHDPCVAIRAPAIVESMLALVLADHLLRDRAQNHTL